MTKREERIVNLFLKRTIRKKGPFMVPDRKKPGHFISVIPMTHLLDQWEWLVHAINKENGK